MTPDALHELGQRFRRRAFKRGEVIFHQGDPGAALHVIATGRVKVFVSSDEGDELLLAVLGPSEFVGDLALIDGQPRSASAMALEDTQTYVLDQRDFFPFLTQHPQAAIALAVILASRLRRTDERLAEAAFLDLPRRLARQLLALAEAGEMNGHPARARAIALTQRELAEMVGASRQRVNQTLGQWEGQGILRRERGRILLQDAARLRRLLF
jgi:CRP-like cAMP-binding protein